MSDALGALALTRDRTLLAALVHSLVALLSVRLLLGMPANQRANVWLTEGGKKMDRGSMPARGRWPWSWPRRRRSPFWQHTRGCSMVPCGSAGVCQY